ncbi:MAG TPA: hypothetical protein VFU71_09485 [Burkholderiaceae bacterium]|nr:hypothetical protein [Burkholderiaceae bacterium]
MDFLLDDDLDIDLDSLASPNAEPETVDSPPAAPARGDPASHQSAPEGMAWFEAASAFGAVRLCVQADGAARHAAAAAVALHQAGPLLDALDDWTTLDLDWRWTAAPEAVDAGSHVVVQWPAAGTAPVVALLALPWALVRHMPPPTGTLAADVRWEAAPATVVVARLALGADELAALEPGGAVVLPDSMRPDWRGLLRALDEPLDAGAPLALAPPHAPKVVPRDHVTAVLPPDGAAVTCEVRLDGTPTLAIARLAGWQFGDLGDLGAGASLWRCDNVPRRCARGTLMPWGDGWALALDAVQSA